MSLNYLCVLYRVDWIKWHGNKYYIDDVIWCGHEKELPKFGKINEIIVISSNIFLALNLYITRRADHHHKSIFVEKSTKVVVEHLKESNVWMSKQHSVETHSLRSCEPGTFHIVTKYFLSNLT